MFKVFLSSVMQRVDVSLFSLCCLLLLQTGIVTQAQTFDTSRPEGVFELAKKLADSGESLPKGVDVNIFDERLTTALHLAAKNGELGATSWLLEHGAHVNFTDLDDKSALHHAVWGGELPVVKHLVNHGASLSLGDTSNYIDKMRHWLASLSHFRFYPNGTALHYAVLGQNLEIATYLLNAGASVHATTNGGKTPLHHAATNSNVDLALLLLVKGADVNSVTDYGDTPLHTALSDYKPPSLDFVKLLVAADANIQVPGSVQKTPLICAIEQGDKDIINYLLSQGADIFAKDLFKDTVLHYLISTENPHIDLVKYVVEKGLDVNPKGYNENTPLHQAVLFGHPEIVRYLVAQGADIEALNADDETPLLRCVGRGHKSKLEITKFLVAQGANIHAQHYNKSVIFGMCGIRCYADIRKNRYPELYEYIESLFQES